MPAGKRKEPPSRGLRRPLPQRMFTRLILATKTPQSVQRSQKKNALQTKARSIGRHAPPPQGWGNTTVTAPPPTRPPIDHLTRAYILATAGRQWGWGHAGCTPPTRSRCQRIRRRSCAPGAGGLSQGRNRHWLTASLVHLLAWRSHTICRSPIPAVRPIRVRRRCPDRCPALLPPSGQVAALRVKTGPGPRAPHCREVSARVLGGMAAGCVCVCRMFGL